jgi:hypothetical protein
MKRYFYFDYIFYRVCKAYEKRSKTKEVYGVTIISLTLTILLIDIIFILSKIIIPFSRYKIYSQRYEYVFITFLIIIGLFSYFRYIRKFEILDGYWKNEVKNSRILKGYVVLISLIAPWICLYFINMIHWKQ